MPLHYLVWCGLVGAGFVALLRRGNLRSAPKFPGQDPSAWDYTGQIEVEMGGSYKICAKTNDGSWLYIDGAKVRCRITSRIVNSVSAACSGARN